MLGSVPDTAIPDDPVPLLVPIHGYELARLVHVHLLGLRQVQLVGAVQVGRESDDLGHTASLPHSLQPVVQRPGPLDHRGVQVGGRLENRQ
eukprot:9479493-Pyramimonas_sp.AAC.1